MTGGLEVASRYQPAGATAEVGGDWFDVIPLDGGKTALVVGDVMGSGINAAATMGRLRTATNTLASLDLEPARLLEHLDRITEGLDHSIATCVYAVHDPRCGSAGSPTPGICRRYGCARAVRRSCSTCPPGRRWAWAESPSPRPPSTSTPVTGWCSTRTASSRPGSTRSTSASTRCWSSSTAPTGPLEEVCDLLLRTLHQPDNSDDVALLIARVQPSD